MINTFVAAIPDYEYSYTELYLGVAFSEDLKKVGSIIKMCDYVSSFTAAQIWQDAYAKLLKKSLGNDFYLCDIELEQKNRKKRWSEGNTGAFS